MTSVFCGIDWATDHHDIALLDEAGTLLDKLRIDDTPVGLSQHMHLLPQHGDSQENPIPVAIETSHGLPRSNVDPPAAVRVGSWRAAIRW